MKNFDCSEINVNDLLPKKRTILYSKFHAGYYPIDTGSKMNVHKTFRRRPGRLLNVLCTFNLRPASTG